jgi:hypothetical protein
MRYEGKPPARASNGGAGYAGSYTVVEGDGWAAAMGGVSFLRPGKLQYFVTPVYWSIPGDNDSRSTGQYFLRLPS